jgi:hypothetical protein
MAGLRIALPFLIVVKFYDYDSVPHLLTPAGTSERSA